MRTLPRSVPLPTEASVVPSTRILFVARSQGAELTSCQDRAKDKATDSYYRARTGSASPLLN